MLLLLIASFGASINTNLSEEDCLNAKFKDTNSFGNSTVKDMKGEMFYGIREIEIGNLTLPTCNYFLNEFVRDLGNNYSALSYEIEFTSVEKNNLEILKSTNSSKYFEYLKILKFTHLNTERLHEEEMENQYSAYSLVAKELNNYIEFKNNFIDITLVLLIITTLLLLSFCFFNVFKLKEKTRDYIINSFLLIFIFLFSSVLTSFILY